MSDTGTDKQERSLGFWALDDEIAGVPATLIEEYPFGDPPAWLKLMPQPGSERGWEHGSESPIGAETMDPRLRDLMRTVATHVAFSKGVETLVSSWRSAARVPSWVRRCRRALDDAHEIAEAARSAARPIVAEEPRRRIFMCPSGPTPSISADLDLVEREIAAAQQALNRAFERVGRIEAWVKANRGWVDRLQQYPRPKKPPRRRTGVTGFVRFLLAVAKPEQRGLLLTLSGRRWLRLGVLAGAIRQPKADRQRSSAPTWKTAARRVLKEPRE